MIVLGFDTATSATVVAVADDAASESGVERRHDPVPGERPGHASQLLVLAQEALGAFGATFASIDRIAVGIGPGGFTGLRIGVATARAPAQAADAELVGVGTLEALALATRPVAGEGVLAVVDARRREVFAAGWRHGEQVLAPVAIAPAQIAGLVEPGWIAVGDGALRYRDELQQAGCIVPPPDAPHHRVSALVICRLAQDRRPAAGGLLVPDYLRKPDAVRPARPKDRP